MSLKSFFKKTYDSWSKGHWILVLIHPPSFVRRFLIFILNPRFMEFQRFCLITEFWKKNPCIFYFKKIQNFYLTKYSCKCPQFSGERKRNLRFLVRSSWKAFRKKPTIFYQEFKDQDMNYININVCKNRTKWVSLIRFAL